jgi:hypothetical protein
VLGFRIAFANESVNRKNGLNSGILSRNSGGHFCEVFTTAMFFEGRSGALNSKAEAFAGGHKIEKPRW